MSIQALNDAAIDAALTGLTGWTRAGEALTITWRFPSFSEAMAWMQACAEDIERMDHHPDWRNVYDRVSVRLSTHDAGDRITSKDVALAKALTWKAASFGAQ